jgi:hypothetical protein
MTHTLIDLAATLALFWLITAAVHATLLIRVGTAAATAIVLLPVTDIANDTVIILSTSTSLLLHLAVYSTLHSCRLSPVNVLAYICTSRAALLIAVGTTRLTLPDLRLRSRLLSSHLLGDQASRARAITDLDVITPATMEMGKGRHFVLGTLLCLYPNSLLMK